jgi:hypothetical protein
MATSGTYAFTMTRDDIIQAALRMTTRFSADDIIPPLDISNCAQALNILCKELVTEGLPLWCVKEYSIPMIAGQATYNLSTATGMSLPVRILDCFLRYSTGNDVSLTLESRYDYNTLGQKTSSGNPNQAYYDPQLGAGTITLYNVPADSTQVLHVVLQRQIMDFNLSTDNPDFPQEAYRLLKWCLADEIALEYGTPPGVRAEIAGRSNTYRKSFFAFEQENVSVQFSPSGRGSQ